MYPKTFSNFDRAARTTISSSTTKMVEFAIGAQGMTLVLMHSSRHAGNVNCRFKCLDGGWISVLPPINEV